jgi:hypothetical protein
MYNPALAAAVTFDRKVFDEFIEKMGRSEAKTHDDEATIFQTQRYEVILKKHDVVQFKPLFNDVHLSLFF